MTKKINYFRATEITICLSKYSFCTVTHTESFSSYIYRTYIVFSDFYINMIEPQKVEYALREMRIILHDVSYRLDVYSDEINSE